MNIDMLLNLNNLEFKENKSIHENNNIRHVRSQIPRVSVQLAKCNFVKTTFFLSKFKRC